MLANLPWPTVTAVVVVVLVAIFFVSGADAASIVMGTLSEKGTLEPSPPGRSRRPCSSSVARTPSPDCRT
jgi:choline-glycine betaine transporter